MVMYSGRPSLYTNINQVVDALQLALMVTSCIVDYFGGVLPGNNSILCFTSHSCGIDGSSNTSENSVHRSSQW